MWCFRMTGTGNVSSRKNRTRGARLTALCGNSFKESLGSLLIQTREWLDKDDVGVWLRLLGIESLDANGHCK